MMLLVKQQKFSSIWVVAAVTIFVLAAAAVIPGIGGLSIGVAGDAANSTITDLSSSAPKYQTAYACEGKKLTIECDPGDLINLIRANYGRFSITICNDHGNVEWSVNCMSPKSLRVLNSRCAHKQSCSVLATTTMFGDPCTGTHKYLEAHYQCISAAQTSTTTNRPSPPWVLTNTPPITITNGSSIYDPVWSHSSASSPPPPTPSSSSNRLKNYTTNRNTHRHDGAPPPPIQHNHNQSPVGIGVASDSSSSPVAASNGDIHLAGGRPPYDSDSTSDITTRGSAKGGAASESNNNNSNSSPVGKSGTNMSNNPNTRILTGVGGVGNDDNSVLLKNRSNHFANSNQHGSTTQSTVLGGNNNSENNKNTNHAISSGGGGTVNRNINNINNYNAGITNDDDEANLFCGPATSRNLFWNVTRVGEVNVQPCPGGATGIAKWRCVLMQRISGGAGSSSNDDSGSDNDCQSSNCDANKEQLSSPIRRNFQPTWHPLTPDLTQCRSLWLNNLEVRVNQRDSSLISIANDLSEVTSSKTLYGGDMLVTTKIIQTMSEKMFYDMETFPDQRQREAIIYELLHGVVKTGSNLLDESQLSSWLDLNLEDQMRVATSLLTGLEDNAFLLADTIIRERNVVQKVKNILLSVRVLETKNIQANEVFPDLEQWQISDDRIELPRGALIENSEGGLVRIVFAAFDRLESILKPSYDHFELKSSRSYVRNAATLTNDTQSSSSSSSSSTSSTQQRVRILNSKVISASLGKGRHIQLSQPIKLVLRHLKTENVSNPTCVFWNYIDHAWSANGCNLESTNRTHSICMCNHLTNFAILMDVLDEHNHSLLSMFDSNMRILIYISISICILFIIIAILTLKLFNGVFIKSTRTSIYRSIYVCLFIIETLFLLGIEQSETSILCGFTAVFLHCFILSAVAWFCFEAFQSYVTLTTDDMLLEVEKSSKVIGYYLMSYGLAFTIVAVSLAIDPSTYTHNDYCVLMESNALFYTTFIAPILLFVLGALSYTFLAWFVMCKKSRTALKNKEHTRLANVRFDIRCSFIFLMTLSADCTSAYLYLRKAKLEDESANVFGYLFITFNTLLGIYIFVFHCIQNEKIRREYRKYIRQNSWLPKCLRCSKTSISSGAAGNYSAGASGTSCSAGGGGGGAVGTNHKRKQPLVGAGGVSSALTGVGGCTNDEPTSLAGSGIASESIIASSECELNAQAQHHQPQHHHGLKISAEGIIPGSLKHGKANSIIESMQGHIVLERVAGGTLRSGVAGHHTPSGGHTSPTSSAGSTHLIFGPKQADSYYHQQPASAAEYYSSKHLIGAAGSDGSRNFHTPYDEKFLYFDSNTKRIKAGIVGGGAAGGSGYPPVATTPRSIGAMPGNGQQMQQHEYFYWTQKNNHHQQKKKHGGGGTSSVDQRGSKTHKSDTMHIFYPSYKKTTTMLKNHPHPHYPQTALPPTPLDSGGDSAAAYHHPQLQQQQHHHHHHRQLSSHQLSSDEDHGDSSTHHLMHLIGHSSRRGGGGGSGSGSGRGGDGGSISSHPSDCFSPDGGGGVMSAGGVTAGSQAYHHRHYRNKHSNCDLTNDFGGGGAMASGSESYYNQGSLTDGPVYEEILSNRNSVMQNNGDDNADDSLCEDDADDGDAEEEEEEDDDDDDEEDDEDDGEFDDDVENRIMEEEKYNRIRRLMAIKDENFRRQRFHRQDNKNPAANFSPHGRGTDGSGFIDSYPHPHLPQQQHHQQHTVFGGGGLVTTAGGGGPLPQIMPGGSMRSFKKSPSRGVGAVGVADNNMFNHHSSSSSSQGPPLPPANQHPMHLRQQQQQQQQSPQSQCSSSSLTQQQQIHQQYPIGRNISAMLDENNTVRCYLEPLPK